MNEVLYSYNNGQFDFTTAENLIVFTADPVTSEVLDIIPVNPGYRIKMANLAKESRITWNYSDALSGLGFDVLKTYELYNFYVIESTDTSLFYPLESIPQFNPETGEEIFVNARSPIPMSLTYLSPYLSGLGITIYDVFLPEMYVGYGSNAGILFNPILTP
jgi:hypothetical protein